MIVDILGTLWQYVPVQTRHKEFAVGGQWDEALRYLRPAMTAADRAAQATQTREQWLASLIPVSNQYGHDINDAVIHFLKEMMRLRPDAFDELRAGPNFQSVRGYVQTRVLSGGIGWCFLISSEEWPNKPYDAYFCVQTSGRWFYGNTVDLGYFQGDKVITVFGFNEHAQFVPSSFPLVEHGTVVTIAKMSILALMHYYGLPLPS